MRTAGNIIEELDVVVQPFIDKALADIQKHVVKPFCDKYDIYFHGGMGVFSFHKRGAHLLDPKYYATERGDREKGKYNSCEGLENEPDFLEEYHAICDALSHVAQPINSETPVGAYVDNYPPNEE